MQKAISHGKGIRIGFSHYGGYNRPKRALNREGAAGYKE